MNDSLLDELARIRQKLTAGMAEIDRQQARAQEVVDVVQDIQRDVDNLREVTVQSLAEIRKLIEDVQQQNRRDETR